MQTSQVHHIVAVEVDSYNVLASFNSYNEADNAFDNYCDRWPYSYLDIFTDYEVRNARSEQ